MDKYDCRYKYWVETDYDIMSGHSDYEARCMRPEMRGKPCLDCYCKFRKQQDDEPSQLNGQSTRLLSV